MEVDKYRAPHIICRETILLSIWVYTPLGSTEFFLRHSPGSLESLYPPLWLGSKRPALMHVGVVGGGISGLYSALMLLRQGIPVTVFEANNRLGGRVYTFHFTSSTHSEGSYFEAGAMRIPCTSSHRPVFGFINFLNQKVPEEMKLEFIPYIMSHENNMSFIRGRRRQANDTYLAAELGLPEKYRGRSAEDLLKSVIKPWVTVLSDNFETGFAHAIQYDEWSFRQYLRYIAGWSHEVIDFVEMMTSQTNQYDLSFTEVILQYLDFRTTG